MPGMIGAGELARLEAARGGPKLDPLFVRLMTIQHAGAIAMADEALRAGGDPRIKAMLHGIRQGQRGEIELMHGAKGFDAVAAATRALVARAGEARAERRAGRDQSGY